MRTLTRIVALVTLILITVSFTLSACLGRVSSSEATQTPQYVVITDTPRGSDNEQTETSSDSELSKLVEAPNAFLCKAQVIEQTYENGFMFWVGATTDERCKIQHTFNPGEGEIWVTILDDSGQVGEWLRFTDDYDDAIDPVSDPALNPNRDGLQQPIRGFGKVWREKMTEEQRTALGYATADEFQFTTDYRYDQGGFLNEDGEFVPRPGVHRILALGGEQFFFDEVSGAAFFIAPR